MKKTVFAFVIGIVVAGLLSFKFAYDSKKNTAEVEQYQGVYIFCDSKPVMEYDYLGTVKGGLGAMGGQYAGIRDNLIKRAKKEYPNAEGLILILKEGGTDRCDAIKFK
ncbi:MAG: hypothetical protein WAQ28_02095 [Bacteroidia bacterium]